jgi:gliding motility associated protien GldN
MKKIISITSGLFLALTSNAQPFDPSLAADRTADIVRPGFAPSLVADGVVDYVPKKAYVAPWQNIRANDVLYKKRVWRLIDTRQKQNMPFRYDGDENTGGGTFIEILLHGIKKGDLVAYSAVNDRFTSVLTDADIQSKLAGEKITTTVINPTTGEEETVETQKEFSPSDVTKFMIKEDVIFDRNVGREVRRIIGLAPIFDKKNEDGTFRASFPLFWIYYPNSRTYLAKYDVYSAENDMFRMNWDDLFERRAFSSYITKTSINNPEQDDIMNYKNNLDRLYESNRSNEYLFNKEHDLWVY